MIKAVLFDVGGTLIHPQPSVPETFVSTAKAFNIPLQLEAVRRIMPLADNHFDVLCKTHPCLWCDHETVIAAWHSMYEFMGKQLGISEGLSELTQSVHNAYTRADHWDIYSDVILTLTELQKRSIRLAVVSNWDINLNSLLKEMGLAAYFEEIFASAEVGFHKPQPEIFQYALHTLSLDPEEALYVGDLPETDGAGAKAAEITPYIIDRGSKLRFEGYTRISKLTDLVFKL